MRLGIFIVLFIACMLQNCNLLHPHEEGRLLYESYCQSCHMEDGTGLGALIPPLAASDMLRNADLTTACIIRYGIKGELVVNGVHYDSQMTGVKELTDVEVCNVMNYIFNVWGNKREKRFRLDEVQQQLENCN